MLCHGLNATIKVMGTSGNSISDCQDCRPLLRSGGFVEDFADSQSRPTTNPRFWRVIGGALTYENECAGGASFTKTFTGQIVIANKSSKFLNSGDSGSLMVQNLATNPRAVGLLYAGSSTSAIANPIGEILQFIGTALGGTATMVGQ
jgi:hypothetical protein